MEVYGHKQLNIFFVPLLKVHDDGFIFKNKNYSWRDVKGYQHKAGQIQSDLFFTRYTASKQWLQPDAWVNFNPVSLLDVESSMLKVRRSNRSVPLYVGSLVFYLCASVAEPLPK